MKMIEPQRQNELMREAAKIAVLGKGMTAPNPCVGALLATSNGEVVARGWHQRFGQAHAEINAIEDAVNQGLNLSELSLFVTLEPCNHQGKTGPCTQAILQAGIRQVYIGTLDFTVQAGGGAEFLQNHGVEVFCGIEELLCQDLIADFRCWQQSNLPYIILKLAVTLDGKIATRNGDSAWVSGEKSLQQVHILRSRSQAVMVGGETFYQDNPSLTCRLPFFSGKQPLAVIVSSRLPEMNADFKLLQKRPEQLIFVTDEISAKSELAEKLRKKGVRICGVARQKDSLDLRTACTLLRRDFGVYSLLVEGGGFLAGSLLQQEIVHEMQLFYAMKVLGDKLGRNMVSGRNVEQMGDCLHFRLLSQEFCGEDLWLHLRPDFAENVCLRV